MEFTMYRFDSALPMHYTNGFRTRTRRTTTGHHHHHHHHHRHDFVPKMVTIGKNVQTLLTLLIVGCCVVLSHGFNTDTSLPIIRRGPEGSYFGYSVTMHRELGENMILVGAPRAQTNQPGVQAGGALYKCPLTSMSFSQECHQLELDKAGNDMKNGEQFSNKSGQMFGATVKSGGPDGPIVACRPLYTWFVEAASHPATQRQPVGGCIIARQNFTEIHEYTPCRNPDTEELWSCQLGLSAAATQDEILIGAVGSYEAKGQIHIVDFFDGFNRYSSRQPKNLQKSDYKGYSVSFGDFDGDGYNEYIIGTPRGEQNRGMVTVVDAALSELINVHGTQMGEYFGHTVTASDFNGDGLDELVVSAPMYSNTEDNFPHYDIGRVYIYQNNGDGTLQEPRTIQGTRAGGRFGFSLAALEDVNQDGFKDLAIGAPYDGATGMGRVYIYHSDGRQGLSLTPSQVLDPLTMGLPLHTFGFSLAGGMDMDVNGYPDLVVGMYKSSAVVLYRSRPIVHIRAELKTDIEGIQLRERNYRLASGEPVVGFNVTLCLTFTGKNVPEKIHVDYDLTADAVLPVTQRAYFNLEGTINAATISTRIGVWQDDRKCIKHIVYIRNSIKDKLTPVTMRANYALPADQFNKRRRDVHAIKPILNNKVPATTSLTIPIMRNCINVTCVPDLSLAVTKNVEALYVGDKKNVVMVITVANRGEDAYQTKLRIQAPQELLFTRVEQLKLIQDVRLACTNDVLQSQVTCDVGNPLPAGAELKLRMEFENLNLSGESDLLTFSLDVRSVEPERHHTRRDNRINIEIPVEVMASMELIGVSNPHEIIFHPELYPANRDIKTESDIGPEISHYFSLINKGPSHIGPTTIHIQWPLFNADGDILLYLTRASMSNHKACTVNAYVDPANLPVESRVLFENKHIQHDRSYCNGTTSSPPSSSESAMESSPFVSRHRRYNRYRSTPADHMNCCSLQNCATITCNLDQLPVTSTAKAEVVISVRSRLWMNTVLQANHTNLSVSSRATATTKGSYYSIPFREQPSSRYTVTTSALRFTAEPKVTAKIPFWIYIVAAAVGILIVILLILVLWKIGFFKRKKITPEQRKKMEHPEPASANRFCTYKRCSTLGDR